MSRQVLASECPNVVRIGHIDTFTSDMRPVQEEDTADLHGWALVDFAEKFDGIYAILFTKGAAKVYVTDAANDFYDPKWEAFAPVRGDLETFLADCGLADLDLPIAPSAMVYCYC